MDAGYAIDFAEMRELSSTRTTEPSRLRELAQRAERHAVFVENRWGELSEEQRRRLYSLTCLVVEPPKGFRSKLRSLRSAIRYARIRLHEDQDALFDFAIAQRRLINAILDAVEREDPDYQRALADAIEASVSEIREGKAQVLTDEDTSGYLRRISDEALK